MWTSIDSSNFARATRLISAIASAGVCSRSRSTCGARLEDAPCRAAHPDHLDAHRAGGARDDLRRRIDVGGVEVRELLLRDLAQLRLA